SVAPKGTILEDYKSRMDWITQAADRFHQLMGQERAYMEQELSTMAGWVHMDESLDLENRPMMLPPI
ncbi:hypothetical protein ABTD77_20370, partial [Acinetobacter baumannii]